MLPVPIHRQRMAETEILQVPKPCLKRRPFALSRPQTDALRPIPPRNSLRPVNRPIIDHQHIRQIKSDPLQESRQRHRFIAARNQRRTLFKGFQDALRLM